MVDRSQLLGALPGDVDLVVAFVSRRVYSRLRHVPTHRWCRMHGRGRPFVRVGRSLHLLGRKHVHFMRVLTSNCGRATLNAGLSIVSARVPGMVALNGGGRHVRMSKVWRSQATWNIGFTGFFEFVWGEGYFFGLGVNC